MDVVLSSKWCCKSGVNGDVVILWIPAWPVYHCLPVKHGAKYSRPSEPLLIWAFCVTRMDVVMPFSNTLQFAVSLTINFTPSVWATFGQFTVQLASSHIGVTYNVHWCWYVHPWPIQSALTNTTRLTPGSDLWRPGNSVCHTKDNCIIDSTGVHNKWLSVLWAFVFMWMEISFSFKLIETVNYLTCPVLTYSDPGIISHSKLCVYHLIFWEGYINKNSGGFLVSSHFCANWKTCHTSLTPSPYYRMLQCPGISIMCIRMVACHHNL